MSPRIVRPGFISIPKDLSYPKWKIEIEAQSDGATHDITDYVNLGNINRRSTTSLSNFSFPIDNAGGRFKDVFQAGDTFNLYYDYTQGSLTTIKFRGRLDAVYNNFNGQEGFFLNIEGRDYPQFADDKGIIISFSEVNVLETFFGTSATQDSQSNSDNGFLYNSELTMRVWDPTTSAFVVYKDLTDGQKTTLKTQDDYNKTVTDSFEDKSRLSIASPISQENDLGWRIEYESSTWFISIFPEEGIKNDDEVAIIGQNITNVNRFGKDTKNEFNRIKIIGEQDSDIMRFRTKSDLTRQSALWIKDWIQNVSDLNTDDLVLARTEATLNLKKEIPNTGTITTPALITLEPGEKIHFSMPYIFTGDLLVPSFTINFGQNIGIEFTMNIKDREEELGDIFKNVINEQNNLIATNNPNDMNDAFVFNFSELGFTLTNCEISEDVLVLSSGQTTGVATTPIKTTENDISNFELRIDASNFQDCLYRVSNDGGLTFESYTLNSLHTFTSTGKQLILEITLNKFNAENPQFNKLNLLTK